MVAYSFQKQFVEPILASTKRQTVRAGRKRHVRPGEPLQLYMGMRTRQCRLIGRAVCEIVTPIMIDQRDHWIYFPMTSVRYTMARDLDFFARIDGFPDWPEMLAFWKKKHPAATLFSGVLIRWQDLKAAAP